MKRVVLVICDGLRADMVRPEWTPNLCKIGGEGRTYLNHQSVFPSTTRTTAASIATGCYPAKHGLEGNAVALDEGRGLVALSVGHADFRDRMLKATGKTLKVPTISERLVKRDPAIIFSNVSPGAAYFQDPDGFGYVYHRSGSFGPGLRPINDSDHLNVSHDANGDNIMTDRFCNEILCKRKPLYSVLWLCEPDYTQHANPLGSAKNLAALSAADKNAGKVAAIVNQQNLKEDILLIIASDHGHQTVSDILPLSNLLVMEGLKGDLDSSDVVVASNGLSANIYLSNEGQNKKNQIVQFLQTLNCLDKIFFDDSLKNVGQNSTGYLAISVTTKNTFEANEFGIIGKSVAIEDPLHNDTAIGCGQHGGLGKFEQNPFLIIKGVNFASKSCHTEATSAVDLAPTILSFLGEPHTHMDGRILSCS